MAESGANGLQHEGTQAHAVYRTRDAARVLRVSPARVRRLVHAGLCRPARHRRRLEFSFQDLVVLRAAQSLLRAKVPLRRIRHAFGGLARQTPGGQPLSATRLYACGAQVVVRHSGTQWCPDSGQFLFSFAGSGTQSNGARVVPVRKRRKKPPPHAPRPAQDADGWFEHGLALERKSDWAGAFAAYERALEVDPDMTDAYINLGRLLHEAGDVCEAARLYARALACTSEDPVAHYNLALALEDLDQRRTALSHYRRAIELDPDFADAHFNLGRLLQSLGEEREGIEHLLLYEQLQQQE